MAKNLKKRSSWWVHEYRCGLHSGIPKCCVKFWVRVWAPMVFDENGHENGARQLCDLYYPKEMHFGYVPCPDCKAKGNPPAPKKLNKCLCILKTWSIQNDVPIEYIKSVFFDDLKGIWNTGVMRDRIIQYHQRVSL